MARRHDDSEVDLTGFSITARPRAVIVLITFAAILATWLIAAYLGGHGVPLAAAVTLGGAAVPALLFVGAIIGSMVMSHRYRGAVSPLKRASDAPPDFDRSAMEAIGRLMADFEKSSLIRVIGVGEVRDARDIRVELLSIELRDGFGAVSLRASGDASALRPSDHGMPSPELVVEDDAGTQYVVAPAGGSGGQEMYSYEFRFAPAPPSAATVLRIGISRFTSWMGPRPNGGSASEAPWLFSLSLQD